MATNDNVNRRRPTAKEVRSDSIERSSQIKRDDKLPIYKVGLYDIDSSVKYYIDNVIHPRIKDHNDTLQTLPVIYGSPERWKSVQKSNFYRDAKGKIQLPLMMYKKTSIEKNRELSSKVDTNAPLIQLIQMPYSKKNKYDNFSKLIGKKPVKEFHRVVVPDYVKVNYECIIWTEYISQMNSIVEAINYAEGSYWGDPKRFNFKSKIDSYAPATEVSSGKDRATKCTFNLELSGFVIPTTIQKQLNSQQTKDISTSTVIMGTERLVDNIDEIPNP